MSIPKKDLLVMGHEPADKILAQALQELAPAWARFKQKLEPYQWAWEFLRRNPEYQKDSEEALIAWDKWDSGENPEFVECAYQLKEKITEKYGLTFPLPWDMKMTHERCWGEDLNGKYWSQAKAGDRFRQGEIYVDLALNERMLIINLDTPLQIYQKILKEMYYEECGRDDPLPSFQISKFSTYLKVYDLRTWGERYSKNSLPSIGWNKIGHYIYPKTETSPQAIKKQYFAAKGFIEGGYKGLVKLKG